jgi:protein SCO1/2
MIDRRKLMAVVGMAPFAGWTSARAFTEDSKPNAAPKTSREVLRDRYFPNVVLTTHEGKKVRFYDDLLKDKIVVLNFMYASCEGVCPVITANLTTVQKLLGERVGRDIFIYSITVRPEEDSPKVLKEYARMHGIGPGWLVLTGETKDVELLRAKLGFVDPNPEVDRDKARHSGVIRFGNEPLQRWGACPGQSAPDWIVASIKSVDWPKSEQAKRAG